MSLIIFNFKEKKVQKKPFLKATNSTLLDPTSSLSTLFQSLVKGSSPSKATTRKGLIKALTLSKAKSSRVKKQAKLLLKVVILLYNKVEDIR